MIEEPTKNISKEILYNEWVKEFLKTTEFPKVPQTPLFENDQSPLLHDSQSTDTNTYKQPLSELPLSLYNISEKNDNLVHHLNANDKDYEKKDYTSPIFFLKNTENTFFTNQDEKKQNYLSESKNLVNQATQTETGEYFLNFPYEKKINCIKTKFPETYDMITLINYIQQEFSTWLKSTEKNDHVILTSKNQHDIAKLKYQRTHNVRKLTRSLSHMRLHILLFTRPVYDHGNNSPESEEPLQNNYEDRCHRKDMKNGYSIIRTILLSNYVNIFLIFVPLGILCGFFEWDSTMTFIFNFLAIIPLAAILSFMTEELSMRLGQTVGSLLNASLGNIVEMIISIIALNKGQLRIVQTSMLGSILSNDLLVLGMCFIAGGLHYREQQFNMTVAQTMSSLMAVATSSLLIPAAFRLSLPSTDETNKNIIILSRGTSLKTHTEFYDTVIEDSHKESIPPIISSILLILVTFLVSVCAEYLVDSIDLFVTSYNVNKTFIGLILIPIVGNAAEHVTAVIVSVKNKMDLAIGVALGSSMQIALFITPSLIIIGWIIGQPLTLYFKTFETVIIKKRVSNEELTNKFHEINPYLVLKINKHATQTEIRSAYRKQALLNHPDKKPESEKEEATAKFEEIAFAYSILSDEKRRQIYDTTGRTEEIINDINLSEWIKDLYDNAVNKETLEAFKKSYQGSDEERQDLYLAYEQCKGSMTDIFSHILCSNVLLDEERFRKMIDEGIERKELKKYKNYSQETLTQKRKRRNDAKKEALEAEQHAKDLGLDKILKSVKNEDTLQALIKQRQAANMENLINNLETKYGNSKKKKSSKK
ncbi:hypothetical protein PCANB_001880 [Pneumocystis canis]|nr:hypothetical protein PCANB_001880 [Pneumocystis canis]